MVNVKICGLTRPCDIVAVNIERPDYIGFVFAKSRRKVTPEQALELRQMLHPDIIPVGVFVNETISHILSVEQSGAIDVIQLHGTENEAYVQELKAKTKKTIIKAVTVHQQGDVQKWGNTTADYLLLDHQSGGSGTCFDWALIGDSEKPYFLAGGLAPNNVRDAIQRTTPFAVDVSSGVETDGWKDPAKIREFIRRVRNG